MSEDESYLGRCPRCTARLPSGSTLIEYRDDDGWPATFAECPDCRDVVHPA